MRWAWHTDPSCRAGSVMPGRPNMPVGRPRHGPVVGSAKILCCGPGRRASGLMAMYSYSGLGKSTPKVSTRYKIVPQPQNRTSDVPQLTKPVIIDPSAVLTPVLSHVAAYSAWDPCGPHMSDRPRHHPFSFSRLLSLPLSFFLWAWMAAASSTRRGGGPAWPAADGEGAARTGGPMGRAAPPMAAVARGGARRSSSG